MALLNTNTSLVWFGDATSKCEQIDILNFRDEITSIYYVEDSKQAIFNVENFNSYVLNNAEAVLKQVVGRYSYCVTQLDRRLYKGCP